MKYRHYAPNTKCKLIYSKDDQKQIDIINKFLRENDLYQGMYYAE